MQLVFTALLIGVLVASTFSFVVMGLAQLRRAGALARRAKQMHLRFSADDPFDIPRCFADFAFISSGHSARAHNVTYGRMEGAAVREFDFCCEVGHGTRRLTRRYSVVVVETELDLPELLMCNDPDVVPASLPAQQCDGQVGRWVYRGSGELADLLAEACADLDTEGVAAEVRSGLLLLCAQSHKRLKNYSSRLNDAIALLRVLRTAYVPGCAWALHTAPARPERSEPNNLTPNVENRPLA